MPPDGIPRSRRAEAAAIDQELTAILQRVEKEVRRVKALSVTHEQRQVKKAETVTKARTALAEAEARAKQAPTDENIASVIDLRRRVRDLEPASEDVEKDEDAPPPATCQHVRTPGGGLCRDCRGARATLAGVREAKSRLGRALLTEPGSSRWA
jgi:hypothetical protein